MYIHTKYIFYLACPEFPTWEEEEREENERIVDITIQLEMDVPFLDPGLLDAQHPEERFENRLNR